MVSITEFIILLMLIKGKQINVIHRYRNSFAEIMVEDINKLLFSDEASFFVEFGLQIIWKNFIPNILR